MHTLPSWLEPYQPRLALPELVEQVNSIYHSFEAASYDSEIIEMRSLWPPLWRDMLAQLPAVDHWRILDFGCGTGFASEQALSILGDKVSVLTAYDPSTQMLSKARAKLADQRVIITSEESAIWQRAPYNLLITNSVLHHLPTIPNFEQYLTNDAFWLTGNEPSSRFYSNPECVKLSREYASYQERMKWLRPSRYIGKLKSMLGLDSLSKTAKNAYRRRLFNVLPDPDTIARLVDFHVHEGFDRDAINAGWDLRWSKTYSFLGPFSEVRAPKRWRDRAAALRQRFPNDGACFCAVWSRS